MGLGVLGLMQGIKRKSICKVNYDILALGGFMITIVAFCAFESVVIKYGSVEINGYLEASYPSSTTMLVMCVMPTAFMVIGRLISGVHWFTDIVGGVLLGARNARK